MDVPEFALELINALPQWREVMAIADIDDRQVKRVNCGIRSYRVYDSHCPHQVTNIPHLALEGMTLTCPKHNWKFDIHSGECIDKGTHPLKSLKTKVEAGMLYARW